MPQSAAGLERQYKLLNKAQFSSVFSQRKSVHGKFFGIHVLNNSLDHPRMGLTVSRRVSKKAVQRNRIKRQIRESFRLNRKDLPSIDFVVVSKVGCESQENRRLRIELDMLWNKASQKCE